MVIPSVFAGKGNVQMNDFDIKEKSMDIEGMSKVISQIAKSEGNAVFGNARRFCALISDTAPGLINKRLTDEREIF